MAGSLTASGTSAWAIHADVPGHGEAAHLIFDRHP
jgi:hypothetical protein